MLSIKKKTVTILRNILSSGMSDTYELEVVRKVVLANLISLVGIICLLIYGIQAYFSNYIILSIVDLITAVILVITFFYLRATKRYLFVAKFNMIVIGILFVYLGISGGSGGTGLLWSFIFPLSVFFVGGIRTGLIFILLFFTLVMISVILSLTGILPVTYDFNFIFRYTGSFIAVSITSYVYEYVRVSIQKRTNEQNIKLEETRKELENLNKKLNLLATTDNLTHLSNRRKLRGFYIREWKRAMRENKPISVIMLDVDFFKFYNDTYGHLAGDTCLRKIAHTLTRCVHRAGDIIGRIGGEEFAVILTDTGEKGAIEVVKRIQYCFEEKKIPHESSSVAPYITMSIGISSTVPQKGSNPEQLIHDADKALYESKERGRNCYTVFEEN